MYLNPLGLGAGRGAAKVSGSAKYSVSLLPSLEDGRSVIMSKNEPFSRTPVVAPKTPAFGALRRRYHRQSKPSAKIAIMPPAIPPTTGPHLVTAWDEEEEALSEGDAPELEVVLGLEGDAVGVPED